MTDRPRAPRINRDIDTDAMRPGIEPVMHRIKALGTAVLIRRGTGVYVYRVRRSSWLIH